MIGIVIVLVHTTIGRIVRVMVQTTIIMLGISGTCIPFIAAFYNDKLRIAM